MTCDNCEAVIETPDVDGGPPYLCDDCFRRAEG